MQCRAYYMMIPEDGTELTPRCEHAATVCTGIRLLLPSGPDSTVRRTIMRHCPKRLCIVQTRTANLTLEWGIGRARKNGVSQHMKGPCQAPVPGDGRCHGAPLAGPPPAAYGHDKPRASCAALPSPPETLRRGSESTDQRRRCSAVWGGTALARSGSPSHNGPGFGRDAKPGPI
jgi:hypothetical protein